VKEILSRPKQQSPQSILPFPKAPMVAPTVSSLPFPAMNNFDISGNNNVNHSPNTQQNMYNNAALHPFSNLSHESGTQIEVIRIKKDQIGCSYETVFGKYIDINVQRIEIEDPYIRTTHQVYNLLRFCELVIKKTNCTQRNSVLQIHLTTSFENDAQRTETEQKLTQLIQNLREHCVALFVNYNNDLHDREIRLNTGMTIKIGRGLDFYQKSPNQFCVGFYDFNLRPCLETTIEIYQT